MLFAPDTIRFIHMGISISSCEIFEKKNPFSYFLAIMKVLSNVFHTLRVCRFAFALRKTQRLNAKQE